MCRSLEGHFKVTQIDGERMANISYARTNGNEALTGRNLDTSVMKPGRAVE